MNKQKQAKRTGLIVIMLLLAIAVASGAPVISQVTFTDPLGLGQQQQVSALALSNETLFAATIEIEGINYSMQDIGGGQYTYTWTPQVAGTKTFRIYASDNSSTSTYNGQFSLIDQTPPQITSKGPSGTVSTENIDLAATTDKNCDCKFDTVNRTFSQMSNYFTTTGGTSHSALLTHLPAGEKTYYIACKDQSSNTAYGTVNFVVNLGPQAQITLSRSSPLKADTYQVTLITSKALAQTPLLQYKYDDEQKYYQISLVGQDSRWEGYLVVIDASRDRVGTFSFSGKDFDGLTGTKITTGEMFIVDTTKPLAPSSIDVIQDSDRLKLSWFYDGEEPDHFNIYRSTMSGVEYVDYYDTDSASPFYDYDLDTEQPYHYRIAAVDKAGNVGELSSEVHETYREEEPKNNETLVEKPETLDSSLEKQLNVTYGEIKSLRFDLEYAISELDKKTGRFEIAVIEDLKISDQAKAAKGTIDSLLAELDSLRGQNLDEAAFNLRLQSIKSKEDNIKRTTFIDVEVLDSLEFTESLAEGDISQAISDSFSIKALDDDLKSNFTKKANEIQDQTTVFQTIISSKQTSLDGTEKYTTLVKKEISTTSQEFNVIFIENIPKEFSRSAKDVTFISAPRVIKDDPVVYWDFPRLGNTEVIYYVGEKIPITDAKGSKLVILPNPASFGPKIGIIPAGDVSGNTNEEVNKVTGNSIFSISMISGIKGILFIFLGIFVIAGLLVYYFVILKEPEVNPLSPVQAGGEASQADESSPDKRHILTLVEHANLHIDNNKLDQAIKEYIVIHSFFMSANFKDGKEKADTADKIRLLHQRISIKKNASSGVAKP